MELSSNERSEESGVFRQKNSKIESSILAVIYYARVRVRLSGCGVAQHIADEGTVCFLLGLCVMMLQRVRSSVRDKQWDWQRW